MAQARSSKSAQVRARLDHPVVDGDGHWLEPIPIFLDFLRQVAGPSVDFVFANPVRLHTAMNPDFFQGTVVEGAVAKLLSRA